MFCPNCGKELEDGAKFCGECGADLAEEQTAEVAAEAAGSAAHQSADAVEFSFEKGKMIGNIVYRRTVTEATVSGDRIAISQSVKKIFRKERTETWERDRSRILSAELKTSFDIWDLIYAIIFVALGFVNPLFFLLTALFLFTGYTKSVIIKCDDGSSFKIPVRILQKGEAEKFALMCGRRA